jgi:hypothetical protein
MNEIICPHCNKAFKIDEAGYANILKQVRDSDFNKQLNERMQSAENEKRISIELAVVNKEKELQKESADKDSEIHKLTANLKNTEVEKKLAIAIAVAAIQKEADEVKIKLGQAELNKQQSEISLKEKYETQIKDRDDAIQRLLDMKARLSTKMVGETLELHCEIEFNRIRAMAFPNAYFEKDNDASSGSKGDYIFRDLDDANTEIVSIMFEMKNENDKTSSKNKNEDFLKELDKDRNEKGCEYAILVSLIEQDSELYNSGIVDVSHRYQKMYVIRPQFFIPIITLLRNAAINSLKYKSELALVKAQSIDITNFETELDSFKSNFSRNYDLASKHFQTSITEIDKSIKHLQATKDALLATVNQLRIANDKAQDVSIKRLTRNNPTMAERFDGLKKTNEI